METDRLSHLLASSVWQGLGAIVGFAALVAYLWFDVARRRRRSRTALLTTGADHGVEKIAIVDAESERKFYERLALSIRGSREAVYRTGHGFQSRHREIYYRDLLRAEEEALGRGVEIVRIQTGARVDRPWADGYADLLERFPDNFRIVAEFGNPLLHDLGLIDPHGHDPKAYVLFETREPAPHGTRRRPAVALFMDGDRWLAGLLAQQFATIADSMPALAPHDIRSLASSFIYFGWGVHMASRKLLRDVPDARRLGTARLTGWRRDIPALIAGPVERATIHHTGDPADHCDGVAYELSWWGKVRLDRLERRAYSPTEVTIEVNGQRTTAFTYVLLPTPAADQPLAPGSWLDLVIEGATENNMTTLLDELRHAGAPIDELRRSRP
jgi:hypothetical protein